MAPVLKKARRLIGSMDETIVQETPNQGSDGDSDVSEDDSGNSDSHISPSDESDHDEMQNSDEATNDQEIVVGRGHAKIGFEWGTGKVMLLKLNTKNQVIGSNAVSFSSQLGILAKDGNKLPLTYTDWRAVSTIQKDLVWQEVKENTDLPDTYKKNCMKKLGKLWKDWKNRLKKKYYTPHRYESLDSEALTKCPPRWKLHNGLCCKANKKSRQQVKLPARLGRKDMANSIEEYRQEYGKEPSKLDLFIYTRKGKNGKPGDKNTEDKIVRLQELKDKLPENLRDDIKANDEIYDKIVGIEAPGCLRSSIVVSKNKEVAFTTQEELDRAVQDKTNNIVASIRKGFEDEISKLKNNYDTTMEMLQGRLIALEGHNLKEPISLNSRRVLALNNGSSSHRFLNSENSSEATETPEMREETNNSNDAEAEILLVDEHVQGQRKKVTKTKKRKTK
ncbi:hypothetical protein OROMI_018834 [Orobanche minor]